MKYVSISSKHGNSTNMNIYVTKLTDEKERKYAANFCVFTLNTEARTFKSIDDVQFG